MNRYEAYLAARDADIPLPPEPRPLTRTYTFDGYANVFGWKEDRRSDAIRYAEEHSAELVEILGTMRIPGMFSPHCIEWVTPFGRVLVKRSRNPEAVNGWVFTEET